MPISFPGREQDKAKVSRDHESLEMGGREERKHVNCLVHQRCSINVFLTLEEGRERQGEDKGGKGKKEGVRTGEKVCKVPGTQ